MIIIKEIRSFDRRKLGSPLDCMSLAGTVLKTILVLL